MPRKMQASDSGATPNVLVAGEMAPDFTLPDLAGRSHTLSSFRGKKVFMVAWASW